MAKHKYPVFLAFVFVIGFLGAIIWKTGVYFETNDDRIITEILSGSLTGKQEYTPYYVNVLFSAPIAGLYHITQQVPWYGLTLTVLHLTALWVICYGVLENCKEKVSIVVKAVILVGVLMMDIYMLGLIQYTSTAALLAIAGYLYLLLHNKYKQGMMCFFILETISYLLREQAMLMIQPLGAVVFINCTIWDEENTASCKRKKVGMWVTSLLIIFFIGSVGDIIGYSGEQWKNYKKFNQARTEMFDYYGTPDYKEVRDILDQYHVSETQYTAFRHYIMWDSPITAECVSQLAEYQKNKMAQKPSWNVIYNDVVNLWTSSDYMKMNNVAIMITAIVFIALLFFQRKMLISVVCLCVSQILITAYLSYRGRCPNRIMLPLFIAQIIFLIVICAKIRCTQNEGRAVLHIIFSFVLCVAILIGGYKTGRYQYRTAMESNRGQKIYIVGREEVKEYCLKNPQNRYVLDAMSFCYYRGSAYEVGIYGAQNSIYSGSWYSKSPTMMAYEEKYLSETEPRVYVIVYDDGEALGRQAQYPAAAYFAEKTGREPQLADWFTVSHGGSYLVWYFGEKQ